MKPTLPRNNLSPPLQRPNKSISMITRQTVIQVLLLSLMLVVCFRSPTSLRLLQQQEQQSSSEVPYTSVWERSAADLRYLYRLLFAGPPKMTLSPIVVDWLSIGSLSRPEYIQAQANTFGRHRSIRYFFNATELDDAEPDCGDHLDAEDVYRIADFCRVAREPRYSYGFAYSNLFYRREQLAAKSNPPGWLCAQRRPIAGLVKLFAFYENGEPLPDYLVVSDDDTYFDMDVFEAHFFRNETSRALVTAGCRFRWPFEFFKDRTLAWGGFGIVFTKHSLELLRRPIHCPEDADICDKIEQNQVGEQPYFRQGQSLLSMMDRLQQAERYSDYRTWKRGYCFHSDWLTTYLVNEYFLSEIDQSDERLADLPYHRMHAFLGSEVTFAGNPTGVCGKRGDAEGACPVGSEICHFVTPEQMEELALAKSRLYPDRYRPS